MDAGLAAGAASEGRLDLDSLVGRFADRTATIGIIGLGYVGLPLADAICGRGFRVIGFDVDPAKVEKLRAGRSYIQHVGDSAVAALVAEGRFDPTASFERLGEADAILICVPTPLDLHREPDLSYVVGTTRAIAPHLRPGQLVVLESTTYPGTTTEIMRPILEEGGLVSGRDFFLAYSPEREDPGNGEHQTAAIPKVVGGDGPDALRLATALYREFVVRVVPVSSTETAEAVKLTENIFRAVNIALVNELKVVYDAMGIDVWEVIEAATTKPFGFMPFYPGPGLGGHCIPVDPFYLTWKAREFDIATRFIELAGEINRAMPRFVVERLALALDARARRGLNEADILLVGVAYKKNVDDLRESPSLRLIELIEARGARVAYHDPFIPVIKPTRDHPALTGRRSVSLDLNSVAAFDAVIIATDHDGIDYAALARAARLVIDTRNACARAGVSGPTIVKA
ncbi:MAG TPA: nucleotide sugar dehydrogenase [Enterovirga sp.]|nr:nucleotide sugar dehydrogenase [Enterovirga sp.]